MKMVEDTSPFFFLSGLGLRVPAGLRVWAALFVVPGVSVFPFVFALLRRLFLGWAFLFFVSLVRSGKGTVEPCVWWGTHRGQSTAILGRFFMVIGRSSRVWHAPSFTAATQLDFFDQSQPVCTSD